jgi:hypothetical protein
MNKIIQYSHTKLLVLLCGLFALLGCSKDDNNDKPNGKTIAIPVEISGLNTVWTKAIGESTHTVNRVLILPFKKIDEDIVANEDINFAPDYTIAKQFDFSTSTLYTTKLDFTAGATYKVFVIGYNQADYDHPGDAEDKFSLGVSDPVLFTNMSLELKNAADVPEFFTATSQAYKDQVLVGSYFKAEDVDVLKTNLTRVSAGLNVEITGIPNTVSEITLIAETLVKGVKIADATATGVVLATDADDLKTFSSKAPVGGEVSFSHYLLPTFDVNKTKLYLEIDGVKYVIKVPDQTGVSSANSITFSPNHAVSITGDYSDIDIGFTIAMDNIGLEDDRWDGVQ